MFINRSFNEKMKLRNEIMKIYTNDSFLNKLNLIFLIR